MLTVVRSTLSLGPSRDSGYLLIDAESTLGWPLGDAAAVANMGGGAGGGGSPCVVCETSTTCRYVVVVCPVDIGGKGGRPSTGRSKPSPTTVGSVSIRITCVFVWDTGADADGLEAPPRPEACWKNREKSMFKLVEGVEVRPSVAGVISTSAGDDAVAGLDGVAFVVQAGAAGGGRSAGLAEAGAEAAVEAGAEATTGLGGCAGDIAGDGAALAAALGGTDSDACSSIAEPPAFNDFLGAFPPADLLGILGSAEMGDCFEDDAGGTFVFTLSFLVDSAAAEDDDPLAVFDELDDVRLSDLPAGTLFFVSITGLAAVGLTAGFSSITAAAFFLVEVDADDDDCAAFLRGAEWLMGLSSSEPSSSDSTLDLFLFVAGVFAAAAEDGSGSATSFPFAAFFFFPFDTPSSFSYLSSVFAITSFPPLPSRPDFWIHLTRCVNTLVFIRSCPVNFFLTFVRKAMMCSLASSNVSLFWPA
jgi:hypothetical protein